jgi:hypothetical protein
MCRQHERGQVRGASRHFRDDILRLGLNQVDVHPHLQLANAVATPAPSLCVGNGQRGKHPVGACPMWINTVVLGPRERQAIVHMNDGQRLGGEQPAVHLHRRWQWSENCDDPIAKGPRLNPTRLLRQLQPFDCAGDGAPVRSAGRADERTRLHRAPGAAVALMHVCGRTAQAGARKGFDLHCGKTRSPKTIRDESRRALLLCCSRPTLADFSAEHLPVGVQLAGGEGRLQLSRDEVIAHEHEMSER